MSLYSKIIKEVAKIVKKEINEAFDFSSVSTDNKNSHLTSAMRDAVQKNVKISAILQSMNIPFMRSGKDAIDKDEMPVYWYGSKKHVTNKFEWSKPISDYVKILRNGFNWTYLHHKDEDFVEILRQLDLYDEDEQDAKQKCRDLLVSPDKGLVFVSFDTNSFYFNGEIYTFGFIIKQTGKVTYYVDEKKQKKQDKIERNSNGQPITRYDEETAFNMYVELMQLEKYIREIDTPYYDAYTAKYDELQKKYKKVLNKPGSYSKFEDPEYKKYSEELDAWEEWATHEFKRDTPEYNEWTKRRRDLLHDMNASLTKKESDKIKLRNGKWVPGEFFNKWCPNKVFRYSMLK